ncbi:phage tail terminator protein, partial [Mannheimia haemolytica]
AEDELDEWAEKIREVVETYSAFEHLEGISLSQYQYEQDQNQRTWHSATLIFDVEY